VSQDDYYTANKAAAPVLKVKISNWFTVNICICIGKGSIASGPEKQLMFQTFFFYFYRDIIHWGH
jgi:hypothetical protein